MGRHISDTRTMRWEIIILRAPAVIGRTLCVDTLRQAAVGCPVAAAICSGKNLRTNIDR